MFIEIAPQMYLIEPPGKGKFPHCYCVYMDGEARTLIDTSCGSDNLQVLASRGVELIVNTHFHEDHILNNHLFTEAQVWAHRLDAPAIRSLEEFLAAYGCDRFEGEQLGKDFIKAMKLKSSPVHRELEDGDILELGKIRLQVVHTPGHTPGHIALWEEKQGIMLTGDIDLTGFGPWYGHLCSNLDDLLVSIQLCREIQPRLVISSHKGLIEHDIDARLQAYRDIILHKEEQVLQALQQAHTLDALVDRQIFYGQRLKLDTLYRWFEKMAIYQHLMRLEGLGLVAETAGNYYKL